MSNSIYKFVKSKLLSHGVRNTSDGHTIITDRALFLDFVRLERAVRLQEFSAVQSAVRLIEIRTSAMCKRHLLLFAYMYLKFSDGTPYVTHRDIVLAGGEIRRTVEYRRKVSQTERLICEWANDWCDRYSESYFRALYSSSERTLADFNRR